MKESKLVCIVLMSLVRSIVFVPNDYYKNYTMLAFIHKAWLEKGIAYVMVHGEKSNPISLVDMVFQGTVLGPPLWNIFYADCSRPVQKKGFNESIFADDLNGFRNFAR